MTEKIIVQGMSCNHCVNSIEKSVGNLKGISSVNVNLNSGEVVVDFDHTLTTLDQIKETIEEQGYDIV
ncbi:copper chaperone CopZ [Sporosarcina ureae]|uniref:copper chaperone CopZ n=1 Tax=Sporosarcina ureae TaxID=1571 RepID=UPI0009DC8161|nr:copper chaperone CopZ [Sporosarcina ureae]ARF16817.1 copper resistance protein CopZ [Sporosarcina ureae]